MGVVWFVVRSVLLALALAPAVAPAQPIQPQHGHPGWLDLKAFQQDVSQRLQRGRQGSDAAHERASRRTAAVWIPRLLAAEKAGDPFASWILHDCDALYDLPRPNVDSTCSFEEDQRQRAAAQLQASPVGREMTQLRTLVTRMYQPAQIDKECSDDLGCRVKALTQTLQALRETIIRTGILPPLPVINICATGVGQREPTPETREQCQMAFHHVFALHALARSYHFWSLDGQVDDEARLREYPYAQFDDLYLDGKDVPKASTPEGMAFHGRFYGEVYHDLEAMQANVRRRLADEPRWGVLMHTAPVGAGSGLTMAQRAAPVRKKPKEFAVMFEARVMRLFAGTYRGQFISTGTSHAITKLYPSASGIIGRYLMVSGDKPDAQVELGLIGPCTPRSRDELLCIWRDPYGIGNVSFSFNRDATEFRGNWGPLDQNYHFHHVEKRYWKELTLWNGKLQ